MSAFGGPLDLKLIELVKENPMIYNPRHAKYSDVDTKELAWQKIGDILQKPARKCKLRWCNIRDMMRRRIRDRLRYPDEQKKSYRYEEELTFMIPHFKEGRDNNDSNEYYPDVFENNTEGEITTEVYVDDTLNLEDEEVKPILTFRKRKRVASNNHDFESSSYQELNSSDPLDVFLMSIGSTLRKFSPYYLNQAKSKIFHIVQEYELEQLVKDNQVPPVVENSR